jgi:putative N6-adenine-specific DNA methylase
MSMQEFFLVALPGLEDIVQAELREWFPDFESKIEHGGVSVQAPLGEGLAMNMALKTPTRILLRMKTFRCRDFPKLYNKVAAFPWKEWIEPDCELTAHASTRLSRLKIKKRIEEACEDGWIEYQRQQKAVRVRGKKADLFVRFVNDDCTLSLDTSGERLHKRGQRKHVGEAPLRETIAAAMIQLLGRKHAWNLKGNVELIDPMMGSGTFLLEAAFRDEPVEERDFAFEKFAEKPARIPKLAAARPRIDSLIGFEKDAKTLAAAKENLKDTSHVTVKKEDFFDAKPLPPAGSKQRWVICNPPYNERLKVKEPLPELYARLFAKAEEVARPDLACFLLPAKAVKGKFSLPPDWKVLEKRPFLNGGIPVVAFVFGRSGVDRDPV